MKFVLQDVAKGILKAASVGWKPYSRLILYGDSAGWVLDWEMRELKRICSQIEIPVAKPVWRHAYRPQSIFFSNHFVLLNDDWMRWYPNRIGFSYFHGIPNTGNRIFDSFHEALRKNHERISRIQVSHSQMMDVTLQSGIDPSKVFLIRIALNLGFFPFRTAEQKLNMRDELGIPQSAFVVGSFQKDGVGWEDGNEPKLIKGPDVFVSTLKLLKRDIPELFVLLSGPARGYVRRGLEEAQIPYKHVFVKAYPDIARLFQALDVYLVASRQEGGPKAILESMASGVPLVTTRVGQAMDLVKHDENAWITEPEDVEGLAALILKVYGLGSSELAAVLKNARATAEANSYDAQIPLWQGFMKGFVESA